jgi:hypothetical protein
MIIELTLLKAILFLIMIAELIATGYFALRSPDNGGFFPDISKLFDVILTAICFGAFIATVLIYGGIYWW